jgi:hypothetical protein
MKSLFEISQLAKRNPEEAKTFIQDFIKKHFSLCVLDININDSSVSLNSVNGFFRDSQNNEYFYKFHTEEGEAENVSEYYRAGILEKAGFPVILPLYQSSKTGEQFLVYPKITAPTFFDVLHDIDTKYIQNGKYDEKQLHSILEAEKSICNKCIDIAQKTLRQAHSEKVCSETIWQLFYRRLVSQANTPRLDMYYKGKQIYLSDDKKISFDELSQYHWIINGNQFKQTLQEIIDSAKDLMDPLSSDIWPVVTAHGDDHNGNKFYFSEESPMLRYFDPAFAGDNIPALLAFVKTTYHDCFAHPLWFYNPKEAEKYMNIDFRISNGKIIVKHNYDLPSASLIRAELLDIKFTYLWKPLFSLLRKEKMLPKNAKDFVKKALFCCPFLCLNLIDQERFIPKQSIFALSRAVEMGSESYTNGNLIDSYLDEL